MPNNTSLDTDNFIAKFRTKDMHYSYTRRMTFQKVRLYNYAYNKKWLGSDFHASIYRFINGNSSTYFSGSEIAEYYQMLNSQINNSHYIKKILHPAPGQILRNYNACYRQLNKIPLDFNKYSNNSFMKIVERYFNFDRQVGQNYWIIFNETEIFLTEKTKEIIKKNFPSAEIKNILNVLSQPNKIITIDEEKLSILRIALLPQSKRQKALQKHTEKFCHMPMYDINYEPFNLTHYEQELRQALAREPEQLKAEIKHIIQKYRIIEKSQNQIVAKFKGRDLAILNFYRHFCYLKEYKPFIRDRGSFIGRQIFSEIARRLNITLDEAVFLTEDEIEGALLRDIKIDTSALHSRYKNSAYLCFDEDIVCVTDKNTLEKIDQLLSTSQNTAKISGLGVSQGTCQGRVKIIFSNNDFNKFKPNEILVTSATRPDFVPLMKIASAIITDEGGLLSHAAIVSRELKIPCIVGTKIATKVLKDGDLVEVDADSGKVKRIS